MGKVGRGTEDPGYVVIITGPAAAGKTTTARRLAEESSKPSVHLHADDFFSALKTGRLRGWVPGAEPQHEVVYDAISAAAGAYAAGGYFVVVDTLVRPSLLGSLLENIKRREIDVHYIVLRPSFAQTLVRSHSRPTKDRHDDATLQHLYSYFDDLGGLEGHVIDNSELDLDQTVQTMRTMLHNGTGRL